MDTLFHYFNLHQYINENYCHLNYDLKYLVEKTSLQQMAKSLWVIPNRGTRKIIPAVGMLDILMPGLYNIKVFIQLLLTAFNSLKDISVKSRLSNLEDFKHLEDQIRNDRELDEIVEEINEDVRDFSMQYTIWDFFGKKKAFFEIPVIKQKLLPRFKIDSVNKFLSLIEDMKKFYRLMINFNKKDEAEVKKFISNLGLEKCTVEDGVRIFEFMTRGYDMLYHKILKYYNQYDRIRERKIK